MSDHLMPCHATTSDHANHATTSSPHRMPCPHIRPHHATALHHVTSHLHHITSCHAMPCHAIISHHIMPCLATTSHHAMPPHHIMPCHRITVPHVMPCHSTLNLQVMAFYFFSPLVVRSVPYGRQVSRCAYGRQVHNYHLPTTCTRLLLTDDDDHLMGAK